MARRALTAASRSAVPVFAALGDEVRMHVVTRLCDEGPLSIAQLSQGVSVSRQAVTKHLQVLESAGLVGSKRSGRENIYTLSRKPLTEAQRLLGLISREWDETLERLRAFVEVD